MTSGRCGEAGVDAAEGRGLVLALPGGGAEDAEVGMGGEEVGRLGWTAVERRGIFGLGRRQRDVGGGGEGEGKVRGRERKRCGRKGGGLWRVGIGKLEKIIKI